MERHVLRHTFTWVSPWAFHAILILTACLMLGGQFANTPLVHARAALGPIPPANSATRANTQSTGTLSTVWYFAEGYTGGSFTEYLTLANPNPTAAHVSVEYLLQNGSAPITKTYTVNANARQTVDVNTELGIGVGVSMVVTSDQPIIAERPMYFTYSSGNISQPVPGGTDVLGATSLGTSYDFGYLDITANHDTYLTILNQNTSALTAQVHYYPATGGAPITIAHTISANSRGTISVNAESGLPQGAYSALVALSQPGLVERPLYELDSLTGKTGSADIVGVTTPLNDWYFAEGFASSTFSERYILSNPTTTPASATVTFYEQLGKSVTASVTLAPGQQQIVDANTTLGTGSISNSAWVHASGPILAERFMSFLYTGPVGTNSSSSIPGATDVLGAAVPSDAFYFAEGFTGGMFGEYLTIANPNVSQSATVQVTFLPANGANPTVESYTISPATRFTLNTITVMPQQSFSMVVQSTSPIVAERPMYFSYGPNNQTGGTDVIGYQPVTPPTTCATCVYVGSQDDFMYSIDKTTGTLLWRYQTGGRVGPAVLGNGLVYFGSTDGYFYALNASDGSLAWRFQAGANGFSDAAHQPALANGLIYYGANDMANNNYAYALNATTGALVWKTVYGDNDVTVANGVAYFGARALDASTGAVLWDDGSTTGAIYGPPVVANGIVYLAAQMQSGCNPSCSGLLAVNATTGQGIWFKGANPGPATVVGNVVYVVLGSQLTALDATVGTVLWQNTADPVNSFAPAVVNGLVYDGASGGLVYALHASDGSFAWSYTTGDTAGLYTPTVAAGVVYIGSDDHALYALYAATGAFAWKYTTIYQVENAPTVG